MPYFVDKILNKNETVEKLPKQFLLFLIIGGITVITDMTVLVIFISALKINLLFSTAVAFIAGTIVNYILSIKFVFMNGRYRIHYEIIYFFILALLALLINLALMKYLVDELHLWYVYSKILIVVLVTLLTFSVKKWIIFLK